MLPALIFALEEYRRTGRESAVFVGMLSVVYRQLDPYDLMKYLVGFLWGYTEHISSITHIRIMSFLMGRDMTDAERAYLMWLPLHLSGTGTATALLDKHRGELYCPNSFIVPFLLLFCY